MVTGASSGIGAAYAKELASRGYDVILVARRRERLETLAATLHTDYHTEPLVVVADLTTEDGIARVEHVIRATDDLNLVVNNAGVGMATPFVRADVERHLELVRLHVHAVVRLTRAALPMMLAQSRGAVVNVSSLLSYFPVGGSATYAGTKCYLRAFTEALHQELASSGVRAQSLCPGFVATEMQQRADVERLPLPDFLWMSPEAVVDRSLRDLAEDRVISVPGLGYRFLANAAGVIPRPVMYALGRWVTRKRLS
jgi:short-subunit dehydrogenase